MRCKITVSLEQLVEGGQTAAYGTNNRPGGSWVLLSHRATISSALRAAALGAKPAVAAHTTGGYGSWWKLGEQLVAGKQLSGGLDVWMSAWSACVLATPAPVLKQGCCCQAVSVVITSAGAWPCASSSKTGPGRDFTWTYDCIVHKIGNGTRLAHGSCLARTAGTSRGSVDELRRRQNVVESSGLGWLGLA